MERSQLSQTIEMLSKWLDAGFYLLPIAPNSKRPAVPGGYKSASCDLNQVRAWLERWPDANWAVACEASNIFVVDCDYDESSASGIDQLGVLAMQYSSIPDTYWQVTPSGGIHIFFKADYESDPLPSTVKRIATHVDTRGVGGYVMIPPSTVDGQTYEPCSRDWPDMIRALHPVPRWLRDLLVAPRQSEYKSAVRSVALDKLSQDMKLKSVVRIVDWLSKVKEGERNNALFWAACELRDLGVSQDDAVRACLYACMLNGLTEKEALATIASAYHR